MKADATALRAALIRVTDRWKDCEHADEDDLEAVEAAGLVQWRTATQDDVDDHTFAAEAGIEVGGLLVELTPAGCVLLAQQESDND